MNARSRLLAAAAVLPLTVGLMPGPAAAQGGGRVVPAGPTVGLELVADGLISPVHLSVAPDGSDRRFVVDQAGLVRIITPDGTLLDQPFLDLRDRMVDLNPFFDERGLLGLAFHPGFADNGRFFVYYSAPLRPDGPEGFNHTSHIAEFTVSASDPDRADPASERILLQVDEPQANHNAGDLHFGPDGFLYIVLGDGGGANDTGLGHTPGIGNGQDATNLLGSLLRIDVDGGDPYGIPADNPFVGTAGRDEIFAYGFRNPYRFTFYAGDPIVADVGQNLFEEVNLVEPGGNYGWNVREATHCFDPDNPTEPPATCPETGPVFGDPLLDPIVEYGNLSGNPDGIGLAVVGGRVYQGSELPQLRRRYVFGDWSTSFGQPDGTLLLATPRPAGLWKLQELAVAGRPDGRIGHFVTGFGQDAAGEVYVLASDTTGPTGETGLVYRRGGPRDSPHPHRVGVGAGGDPHRTHPQPGYAATSLGRVEIHPLTRDRFEDLADLFGTNSITRGCWCMYYLRSGRELSRAWGAGNRAGLAELAATPGPPAGLLAYRDREAVGWCALSPRSRYARALRSPVLKGRDPDQDDRVWLVPCFFVRRDARRTGLTGRLLSAAVDQAAAGGATAVEGFPLAAGVRRPPAEAYFGSEQVFLDCGFRPVARPTPIRVVMRRELAPA